jgi:geranylgeranyl reductase family protein
MIYDAAIVGAGPAGSWLARELARNGFGTILLERSSRWGEPNFSSAVAPEGVVDEFGLARSAVAARWTTGKVYGPRTVVTWDFGRAAGVVFDFRELKAALMREAAALGVEVRLGTTVKSAQPGADVTSVLTTDGQTIEARVVVDASGWAGVLADQFGVKRDKRDPVVGVELICRTDSMPAAFERNVEFYFGHRWSPHGYAWVFPMSTAEVKAGVCVYRLKRFPRLKLGEILNKFVASVPWLKGCEIVERHGGFGYLRGGVSEHVSGNMIAIGDAADQINPMAGEGIRHALHSARIAHGVICRALHSANVAELKQYNRLWKDYVAHRWKACAITAELLYRFAPDSVFEFFTRRFGKLTPEEALEVAFDYRSIRLLATFFRNRDRALVSPIAQAAAAI